MKRMKLLTSTLIVAAMLTGLCVTVQAQGSEIQITGEITAISPIEGGYMVTLLDEEGNSSDIFISQDTPISMDDEVLTAEELEVGWTITVVVMEQADGSFYAISVSVVEEDETGETGQHPVAALLAEYFGVDYEELMAYHDSGVGFGLLARAYFLANLLADEGFTVEDILTMKESGKGFGYFLHEYGIHPGSYNLGAIMSGKGVQRKEKGEPPGHAHKQAVQEQSHNNGGPGQMRKDSSRGWIPPGQAKKAEGK